MTTKNLSIVIPCFNGAKQLVKVLRDIDTNLILDSNYTVRVIVIDDGSQDTISFPSDLKNHTFLLVRHSINLEQGASLLTGFQLCLNFNLKNQFVITMDSNGQHSVRDIPRFIKTIEDGNFDIIFGNRFDGKSNIPLVRKFILKLAVIFEYIITGCKLSDAHNGFRCMNTNALKHMCLKQNRMAHATEIKRIVKKNRLSYTEIPNTIKYTVESLKNGQSNLQAMKILIDLVKQNLFEGH